MAGKKKTPPRNSNLKCTFEKIAFAGILPYWLAWPLNGLIVFILSEILSKSVGEEFFFWDRVIFSLGVATVPVLHIRLFYFFDNVMRESFDAIWRKGAKFEARLEDSKKQIFTLRSPFAKMVTGLVAISGIATTLTLGIPFGNPFINAAGLLAFTPFLLICGQALYIAIALLAHLARLARLPASVPFFFMPAREIRNLRNLYLILGLSILVFYIGLFVAIWQGPYGFHPLLVFWLSILAFYPFGILVVSHVQIHALAENIKRAHIKTINDKIQRALKKMGNRDNVRDIELIEKLMSVQEKVQAMRV